VGERPGTISLTASTNFPAYSGGLSVTDVAGESDEPKCQMKYVEVTRSAKQKSLSALD
jgi:hypothetical protein